MQESFNITTERSLPKVQNGAQATRTLATKLRHVFSRVNGYSTSAEQIVALSVELPPCDPLVWLRAQNGASRMFWDSRDHTLTMAMIGEADVLTGPSVDYAALKHTLAERWSLSDEPLAYIGGFRFDATQTPSADWQPFAAYRLVLPRFMLRQTPERTTLTCHLVLPRDHEQAGTILRDLERMAWPVDAPQVKNPDFVYREDTPDAPSWDRNIKQALNTFCHTRLSKVVLARRSTLGFGEALDPLALLQQLRDVDPNRFHFSFEMTPETAFIGATPERLLKVDGRDVWSEAVAGTRPRGQNVQDDAELRDELLQSEKDQREHEFVRMSIKDTLSRFCETLEIHKAATDLKLSQGRHLFSPGFGVLRPDVHALDLVEALHPTPAVGGYPYEEARAMIAQLEGFDRGWYAGPVGWISPDAAEFAVAIRSGLVHKKALALYAGAGIVRGSEARSEWNEIEQKISDFMRIFGVDADPADSAMRPSS